MVSLSGDPLDKDGCIVNPAQLRLIRDPWHQAVTQVVTSCRDIFADDIHGIYVRGSVARGTAVEGIADLDIVLVLREFRAPPFAATINRIEADIGAAFPFLRGVEVDCVGRAVLRGPCTPGSRQAFLLKTQAICFHGADLIPALPPARLDRGAMIESRRLESSIAFVRQKLASPRTGPRERQAYCLWLMKIIVRSAFELVCHLERRYTRELRACAAIFSKHHPAQKAAINQAVAWAIDPADDPTPVTSLLDSFALWLVAQHRQQWRSGPRKG